MKIVVIDSSVIINFANGGMFHYLGSLTQLDFVFVGEVEAEIMHPLTRQHFEMAKTQGWLRRHDLATLEGLNLYTHYKTMMESGEAASLALAITESWVIACDEHKAFRAEAQRALGDNKRLYTTAGLMMSCIRHGVFDIAEADRLKEVLAQKKYKMSFGSFAELIDAST